MEYTSEKFEAWFEKEFPFNRDGAIQPILVEAWKEFAWKSYQEGYNEGNNEGYNEGNNEAAAEF